MTSGGRIQPPRASETAIMSTIAVPMPVEASPTRPAAWRRTGGIQGTCGGRLARLAMTGGAVAVASSAGGAGISPAALISLLIVPRLLVS